MKKYKENTINFIELIDKFILDKSTIKNTKDQIIINDHSYGLSLINADEELPLMISGVALHKVFYGKHQNTINPETIKNIAKHIKDDSILGIEGFGTSKDKFAIFIDVKDKDNKPILIGLSVGKEILSEQILINEIVTVFGKEDIQSYLNNAVSHSSKIFMNKKSNLWLASNGLQLPNEASKVLTGYSSNIPSQNNDVKLPSAKEVEEAIERARRKPLNLKKYQDKAKEHNKELKKSVASLE